jgi:hypothetical protein
MASHWPPENAPGGDFTLSDDRTIYGCWILSGKGMKLAEKNLKLCASLATQVCDAIDIAILLPKLDASNAGIIDQRVEVFV